MNIKNNKNNKIIKCTFCEGLIIKKSDLFFTEDGEPTHEKCLFQFKKHWNDRDEMMDLMGY